MAIYEEKVKKNGVIVPIQCLYMYEVKDKPWGFGMHYHEYIELLFALDGEGLVRIGDMTYLLEKGGMVVVPVGEPHDVMTLRSALSYIVVKFLPQVLRAEGETFSEYRYTSFLMESAQDRQLVFTNEELSTTALPGLFRHMMQEWKEQTFGYELSLRADVTQIYLYMLRCWRKKNLSLMNNIEQVGQHELIQTAIAYVREHYDEITETDIAAACGVSTAYFSRIFKRAMKVPFSAYVAGVRLKEAQRLLLLTDRSVTDIAQTVGFSTASYFISLFRKEHQVTPYQYRRAFRENNMPPVV